jgi:hypothetical protein
MRAVHWATAAMLVLVAGGCGSDDDPAARPTPTPGTSQASTAPSLTPSDTPESSAPAADLDWQPVAGSVRNTVTRSSDWTLTVRGNGAGWSLDGPTGSTGGGRSGWRVSDALLDRDWAVVVLQERTESQPSRAEITELATGDTFVLDGASDVPTTNGGTWALGDGRLLHATVDPGGSYCVATVDLATRASTLGWCAPKRHGFNGAQIAPGGDSVLSFDAGRPSCRTLMALDGTDAVPFEGVDECVAWDGLRTDDGAVWSTIPDERRIEEAHFYATTGGERSDLGSGTAGSLVWCSAAAYFTRDPEKEGDPAALLRWSPTDGLDVVYESPGGRAFLSQPRCGGDHLTITAAAEAGDEQVTAALS